MRLIGRDMALFQVDTVGAGSPADYVTTIKTCEVNYRIDMQENGAVLDTYHYHQPIRADWTITFGVAVNDAAAPALFGLCKNKTSVTVTGHTGGRSPSAAGPTFTGQGALQSAGMRMGVNQAHEHTFEIVSQSDLTFG